MAAPRRDPQQVWRRTPLYRFRPRRRPCVTTVGSTLPRPNVACWTRPSLVARASPNTFFTGGGHQQISWHSFNGMPLVGSIDSMHLDSLHSYTPLSAQPASHVDRFSPIIDGTHCVSTPLLTQEKFLDRAFCSAVDELSQVFELEPYTSILRPPPHLNPRLL